MSEQPTAAEPIVVSNNRAGEKLPDPPYNTAARRPYYYTLFFDFSSKIAYGDDATQMLSLVIPGYLEMTPSERLDARIKLSIGIQQSVYSANAVNTSPEDFEQLDEWEWLVGTGQYGDNPLAPSGFWKERYEADELDQVPEGDRVDVWAPAVFFPLVLTDVWYAPHGEEPEPIEVTMEEQKNLVILQATQDDDTFLRSLSNTGYITLLTSEEPERYFYS